MAGGLIELSSGGFLAQYEAACRAVAELRTVDEAKQFRDKAEAVRAYARQAKNRELELDAEELRVRAEIKLGEIQAEQPKAKGTRGQLSGRDASGGAKAEPPEQSAPTLAELGIDKKLSARAQKLAKIPGEEIEEHIKAWREEAQVGAKRASLDLVKRARVADRADAPADEKKSSGSFTLDLNAFAASGKKWGCIYADPPWLYDNQGTRAATSNHYNGMTVEQLCALPVGELAAADAHLHLWTTNGFLFECPKIFAAWGFEFRSSFVWVKPKMGIGNYWRNSHEILLTAVRGKAKRFNDKSLKSWAECDRGAHSAKPEIVRSYIERASRGPYLELFARTKSEGWDVWGNQIEDNLLNRDVEEAA